jgi:peptidylprolyl isomerase
MRRTHLAALATLLAAVLALAGCGDRQNAFDDGSASSKDTGTTETSISTPTTEAGPPMDCTSFEATAKAQVAATGTPTPAIPDGPATELCVIDVVTGNGDEVTQADATKGVQVKVNYVGVGQSSKQTFDSSFQRGEPISFRLNGVIKGWTDGLVGMKVGGRRELVIPGDLAYGTNSPTPDIAPNETLVFVVDLLAIER